MAPGGTGPIEAAVRLLDGTVVVALFLGLLVSVPLGVVFARRAGRSPVLMVLTIFSVVFVAVATLQMGRAGGGVLDRDPFDHMSFSGLGRCLSITDGGLRLTSNEARLNLALYMPFGVFATLALGRPWRVLAWSIALILLMEGLQSILDVGICSGVDVVTNVVGVAIAIAATVAIRRLVASLRDRDRDRRAPR